MSEIDTVYQDPAPSEIVQDLTDAPAAVPPLPVVAAEPLNVRELPSRQSGLQCYDLTTTLAVQILGRDPRRKRAVVTGFTTQATCRGARMGPTQAGALSGYAFLFPSALAAGGFPAILEIGSEDELWAVADTQVCTLSVINEQWAD